MKLNLAIVGGLLITGFLWWGAFDAIKRGTILLIGRGAMPRVSRSGDPIRFWWTVSLRVILGVFVLAMVLSTLYPSRFQGFIRVLLWHPTPH